MIRALLALALCAPAVAGTCAEGDAAACFEEGKRLAEGRDVERSYEQANELLKRGCDLGSLPACTKLGFHHLKGHGTKKDPKQAAQLYTRACEGGEADACLLLSTLYMTGEGVERDPERAKTYLERAKALKARRSEPQAGSGSEEPTDEQLEHLCERAEIARACMQLGWKLAFAVREQREPTPQEAARGAHFLLRACGMGLPEACTGAGMLHVEGKSVREDPKRSAELFERACADDEALGCARLALLYEDGKGVKRDPAKAVELHDKACQGRFERSCLTAGLMHALGEGVAREPAEAAAAFSAGCDLEDMYACAMLGVHYENGAGTDRDPDKARAVFDRAWDLAIKRLAKEPDDRDLVCDHAELAINLRREDAEVRPVIDKCVRTSEKPYQKVVAHVLALTAARLAGRGADVGTNREAALKALPGASDHALDWSFRTLRAAMLGRDAGQGLLPLLRALDEADPKAREKQVKPLLRGLR